jgi:hypothetical protein
VEGCGIRSRNDAVISCEPKLAKHLQTRRVRLARMILALAVPRAAKGERLWPPVAVSKLGGIRTEEARALRWSEVDLGCVPTPAPPGFCQPLPLRWARCPTAKERQTEAKPDPLGSQLGDRDLNRSND